MMIKGIGFWGIALLLAVLLIAVQANAEMREFKLPDGRALKAEIEGFNAKLDQVELKREDGKRVKVKPGIFVEADQEYIQEWASLDGFRNTAFFKVDCSKKLVEKWKKDGAAELMKYERFVYEVGLENRNAHVLETIEVDYRIFYEQERNDQSRKVVASQLVKSGTLEIDRVWPKEKRTLSTESVVLEKYEFNTSEYYDPSGDPQSTSGKIYGIWVKIKLTTPSGLTATREIFDPASIEGKYTW